MMGFSFDIGKYADDITIITIRYKSLFFMAKWAKGPMRAGLVPMLTFWLSMPLLYADQVTSSIEMHSVLADGVSLPLRAGRKLSLSSSSKRITFNFGPAPENPHPSLRLRCLLEGYEDKWHEGGGFMFLAVRFFNAAGDQIGQTNFPVTGESAGWGGALKTSPLTHRRVILVVPPNTARAYVVISSAGPAANPGGSVGS